MNTHALVLAPLLRFFAWALSLSALFTGIGLTVTRETVRWYDDGFGEVEAVWPAGLVLLGVGVLSTVAVSMIEAHRLSALIAAGGSTDPGSAAQVDPDRAVAESGSGRTAPESFTPPAAG